MNEKLGEIYDASLVCTNTVNDRIENLISVGVVCGCGTMLLFIEYWFWTNYHVFK